MEKKETYITNKNIEKILNGQSTNFLDPKELKNITSKLKKNSYNIYYPYKDAEKVIIHKNNPPQIKVLEIITYYELTHREILGSLFALNIVEDTFGDIIIKDNKYYILLIDSIYDLVLRDLTTIGNKPIKLKETSIDTISNYEKDYEDINIIASSLRIDTIISRLININRNNVKEKIDKKEIILNYDILKNNSYILKENDIFSIRKYGKYKFIGIIKNTKKDNYIINIKKYI